MSIRKIAILSIPSDDWGGSEELWGRSIPYLQEEGYSITVLKNKINFQHSEFIKLANRGVNLIELLPKETIVEPKIEPKNKKGFIHKYKGKVKHIRVKDQPLTPEPEEGVDEDPWIKNLKVMNPDFVIISQGINFDGLLYAYRCGQLGIPYFIICQKAVDFYWPLSSERHYMTKTLQNATKLFFVSKHNHRLTEEQFGVRFKNAEVVYNPIKVSNEVIPFPAMDNGYKLACIARLFVLDKGQDILIRILSKEKWRNRPLTVSLIGTGADMDGLKAMAELLEVDNIKFIGQVDDIEALWKDYHALVLPSRSEGLPLSMVEAMALGRPVITTKSGGNAELVDDGVTGFLGQANEESFEETMERAWHHRNEWEQIGINASAHIKKSISKEPEIAFARQIHEVINKSIPLVSVIIPTYNREKTIHIAIESVLNQTYQNIQLIVIDDGSVDNTAEVVAKYKEVEYYYQPNGRQASARNHGLSFAKGAIIATLDSDDIWDPEFLTKCVSKMESDQLDFVFANWAQGTSAGTTFDFLINYPDLKPHLDKVKDKWISFTYPELRTLYLQGCPSPSSSVVMRRSSMVSGWNTSMNIGDDWCLLLGIVLSKECKVAFTTEQLWHKKVDSINIYDGRSRIEVVKLLYIEDLSVYITKYGKYLSSKELSILTNMYMDALVEHAKHSLLREYNVYQFLQMLKRSMKINPFFTMKTFPNIIVRGFGRHLKLLTKSF